jgi:hypothetical protein
MGAVPDRAVALLEVDQAVVVVLAGPQRAVQFLDSMWHRAEWTAVGVAEAVGVHGTVAQGHLEPLVALGTWS